jgi:3-oxoacyl-[acyl-carrier protein] reductase
MYEARPFDVRVTCLFPSTVATDMIKSSGLKFDETKALQPEDIAQAIVSLVRLEGRALPTQLEIWQTNP